MPLYRKKGNDGTNGVNGESAYQIAVRLGFQGTEQQWLESLKGSSYSLPTNTKTTASGDDFILMIDANGSPYKIKKSDLFAGLSSGTVSGGASGGNTSGGSGTDTYFSNVAALFHFDVMPFVEVKQKNITVNGSPATSTSQKKLATVA